MVRRKVDVVSVVVADMAKNKTRKIMDTLTIQHWQMLVSIIIALFTLSLTHFFNPDNSTHFWYWVACGHSLSGFNPG